MEEGRKKRRRWLRLSLPVLLLLLAGVSGMNEGLPGQAATPGQWFVLVCETGYGVTSFVALYGLLSGRRWARPAMLLWGALVTAAAAVATIAFGDAGLPAAVVGGVATAGICALAIWLAFPRLRHSSGEEAGGSPREETP